MARFCQRMAECWYQAMMQRVESLIPHSVVQQAVRAALAEDLGRAGDITSQATVPNGLMTQAHMVARSAGVLAGIDVARAAFLQIDSQLQVTLLANDGQTIGANTTLMTIRGAAQAILAAERVALNFVGHMSGIATQTQRFVAAIKPHATQVVCTRKTLPNLRVFQKYAIRCGGGFNHRFGLDDAILIKDNHIALAGGVIPALRAAKRAAGHLIKIEIEVDTLSQLDEVLAEGVDVVLLDNMSLEQLTLAVERTQGRAILEASGNMTLDRVAAVAATGVDIISVGALTHSVTNLDIGLDIEA